MSVYGGGHFFFTKIYISVGGRVAEIYFLLNALRRLTEGAFFHCFALVISEDLKGFNYIYIYVFIYIYCNIYISLAL